MYGDRRPKAAAPRKRREDTMAKKARKAKKAKKAKKARAKK